MFHTYKVAFRNCQESSGCFIIMRILDCLALDNVLMKFTNFTIFSELFHWGLADEALLGPARL